MSISPANKVSANEPMLSAKAQAGALALLAPFDVAREKLVAGWLRIAFFLAILFYHAVPVRYEFLEERMWIVWAQMLRDFGVVGFFALAGTSLRGKTLARARVTLPGNVLKLAIAAAALAVFDMAVTLAKGGEVRALTHHFYEALYGTNLWFFVAYAFAGPLLLSLDRRNVFRTGVCCLLFIMFPADAQPGSPYILQTISLAFVCMAIGMELHGRQARPALALVVAAVAYVARTWVDDHGMAVYPALDVVLRLVYGTACFLLLKALADRLCRRAAPPGWSNYLFVPYLIQFPLVAVATVLASDLFEHTFQAKMLPIFLSFRESLFFMLTIFALTAVMSLLAARLLCRYRIRA